MNETDMPARTLEQRVQRIEDGQGIRQLVNRYCIAIDDMDWETMTDLFAEDGEFMGVKGRQGILEFLQGGRAKHGRALHVAHGQVLDFVDDDHASGVVPVHAEVGTNGQTIACFIRYYDTYVREGGLWRFARRDLRVLYALPWAELGGSLTSAFPVRWPGEPSAERDEFPSARPH